MNGVSALHSRLVQTALAPDFHRLWPERFNNKTNGHSTSVLYNASVYRDDRGGAIGVAMAARPIRTSAGQPLRALSGPDVIGVLSFDLPQSFTSPALAVVVVVSRRTCLAGGASRARL